MAFLDFLKIGRFQRKKLPPIQEGVDKTLSHVIEFMSADLKDLDRAVNRATARQFSNTKYLQDIYNSICLDDDVWLSIGKRRRSVLTKEFGIYKEDGTLDEDLTNIVCGPWFKDLVNYAFESQFYWYSLVFFHLDKNNEIQKVESVPRENVLPYVYGREGGAEILMESFDSQGLKIDQMAKNFMLIQLETSSRYLGLLHQASFLVIAKRAVANIQMELYKNNAEPTVVVHANKAVQVVGGTTADGKPVVDPRLEAVKMLRKAKIAILDKESSVSIVESTRAAFAPILALVNHFKANIDKLFLGQEMTTNTGSSRAQAEVHQVEQKDIFSYDTEIVLNWLNYKFRDQLKLLGYRIPDTYMFGINQTPTPDEKRTNALKLLGAGVRLDPEFLEDLFHVKVSDEPNVYPPNAGEEEE
ncbi:MAG: hypothetical protein OXB93_01845 [Cytophagales bacterium]|nr:hypothetical protein [Cytophagales bacterium]